MTINSTMCFVGAFFASLFCPLLESATVSIVNQTPQGLSSGTTSSGGSSAYPTSQGTNASSNAQNANGQKVPLGPMTGKLSPSSSKSPRQSRKPRVEAKEETSYSEQPVYTFPGMLAKIGRRWVGNDYLYDLPRNIGVKVEVVRQEGAEKGIDPEGLSAIVAEIFQKGGLVPESLATTATPPLPFFHILIFSLQIDKNNVAFVAGRLFEDALLARYDLDPLGTWQVISWEKQDLVATSPLQFEEQLAKSVAGIAQTFVDRVETYAKIKEETEGSVKLYFPTVIPEPPRGSPSLR